MNGKIKVFTYTFLLFYYCLFPQFKNNNVIFTKYLANFSGFRIDLESDKYLPNAFDLLLLMQQNEFAFNSSLLV